MVVVSFSWAGGWPRDVFNASPLGGGLGRSWRSFCLIFSPSFLKSIFHGLFVHFGGIWGGFREAKLVEKLRFWAFGEDMMFETLILVEFCLSFDKIEGEKNAVCLVVFCVILGVFLTLETFKIVLPSRRELNFYKIAFFALDEKRQRK